MSFKYFKNPIAFAYMAEKGVACHFCGATSDCLDGTHFFGQEDIGAICFTCMKTGRLIELDISTNEIDEFSLDSRIEDSDQVANEITYCTPSVPTWQDSSWPVKNGRPYKFIKIASKLDYESKAQFLSSLFEKSEDPEWLWNMLPDHKIENMEEGQYDISFYLYELKGDIITTWDAN